MAKKSAPKIILLTGFEPFDKHKVNSSWVAVSSLDGAVIGDCRITVLLLPVTFRAPVIILVKAIRKLNPVMILSFGLRDRPVIGVERVALNLNKRTVKRGRLKTARWHWTRRDGPVGYTPTVPIERIERALRRARLPAELSAHAGTYICNHVFYGALDYLRRKRIKTPCGFIHVPPLKTRKQKHGLTESNLRRCAEIAVRAALSGRPRGNRR